MYLAVLQVIVQYKAEQNNAVKESKGEQGAREKQIGEKGEKRPWLRKEERKWERRERWTGMSIGSRSGD